MLILYARFAIVLCFWLGATPPNALAGINEISSEVYKGVEHSDSEDSEAKSDSSDSEYASDEGAKVEDSQDSAPTEEPRNESRDQDRSSPVQASKANPTPASEPPAAAADVSAMPAQEKIPEKESPEKTGPPATLPVSQEKGQVKEDPKQKTPADDSDSEGQLVIDLGEEQAKRDRKRRKKDSANAKEPSAGKPEGAIFTTRECDLRWNLFLFFKQTRYFFPKANL